MKLTGAEVSYVREVSEVDLRNQTVTMRSMNLTACNIVSIQETVVYTPHPQLAGKTLFTQGAQITAYGAFSRICTAVEEWSVERFNVNAQKGRMGFEAVLEASAKAFREIKEKAES